MDNMGNWPGFCTDLPNGIRVSVQWHEGAYAKRRKDGTPISVEIACYIEKEVDDDDDLDWRTKEVWGWGDNVIGYVPVRDVVKYIDIAFHYQEEAHND
jgi:hypothetical protein